MVHFVSQKLTKISSPPSLLLLPLEVMRGSPSTTDIISRRGT